MKFVDEQLTIDCILPDLKAGNQKQVFQEIAKEAAEAAGLDQETLLYLLMQNEKLSTSGVGGGVALPQIRVPGLEKPIALFAKLANLVDFDTVDGDPVDLVFLLLSPEDDGPLHLRRLSRISRMLRDQNLLKCLRTANSKDSIYALLVDPVHQQREAA